MFFAIIKFNMNLFSANKNILIQNKSSLQTDMKRILYFLFFFHLAFISLAQTENKLLPKKQPSKTAAMIATLNGQWRGFFGSNGDIVATGSDNTEYVLELNIDGTKVSGYSYSYFQNRAYYVICSLEGELDIANKTLVVTETARIKGSTPFGWNDCLQTHTLTYKKEGPTEVLTGSWKTAPGQLGDCGFGNTTLTKKTLSKNLASYNSSKNSSPFSAPKATAKSPAIIEHSKPTPSLAKNTPKQQEPPVTQPELPATAPVINNTAENIQPAPEKNADIPVVSDINYEKRNTNLLQTITIDNPTISVDLYDNGIVDGDSISLFYNGKLILSHQRLSETAITIKLNVNTNRQANDLTMYAENLGEIPPNTALMVVKDGDKRYEIPVTSDLKNSGTVRFIFNAPK